MTRSWALAGLMLATSSALGGKRMEAVDTKAIATELEKLHGAAQKDRIDRGLRQVAALWRKEDGDLAAFAKEHFVSEPKELDALLARFEQNLEVLEGHFNEIGRDLRRPTDLDWGPLLKIDPIFAGLDASAHLTEDLFQSKAAFVALLNFPLLTLAQKLETGAALSRSQWAQVRLAGRFSRRVPAELQQKIAKTTAEADLYISEYNVWMHHLLDDQGRRLFPSGKRLISHWNLRDELKAGYAEKDGLDRQRMIVKVMERIVAQEIPASVIDNPYVDWNPYSNQVSEAPKETIEKDAPPQKKKADPKPEPDLRYQRLWANYEAAKLADPYSPVAPTQIARAFDQVAEMSEERVKAVLTEVLDSPVVPKVAKEIERRLGRPLEPLDLWFNGFAARGKFPEAELDALCKKRFPSAEAFAKEIPRLLQQLGFSKERANYLAVKIAVDPSRGAGHAFPAARRGDLPRLRTRVEKDGMDYKGFNIAVHELGHNVEQVYSLYDVDRTLLAGVPNTAFTEALAFVFQAKDVELLGLSKPDPESERARVLNDFWMTWEIAGVALVDIAVWHWMYEHPKASPAQLRQATLEIARQVWNRHYAKVLGGKDSALLGIYSHMISYPLYLFNYPLGHLIAFQIEEQVKKTGKLGPEFERMARYGSVTPDLWMQHATGAPVSAGPLLRATEAALK